MDVVDIGWCSWLDHWGRGRIKDGVEHPGGRHATYLHIGKIVWEIGVKCGGGRQAERGMSVGWEKLGLEGFGGLAGIDWRGGGATHWE
jgi:hypothetical protein